MTALAFRARWILPIEKPPIADGFVVIADGQIVSVGPRQPDEAVIDLGDVALLPGLVNAHTHLEFSHLQAPLGQAGESIADWIPRVIAARLEGPARAAALASGLAETLSGGATLVADIARPGLGVDAYAASNRPTPAVVALRELIAPTARAAESLSVELEGEPPEAVRHGLAPHAPYTVHPQLLARAVAESQQHGLPLAMHLAESVEEIGFIVNGRGPLAQMMAERGVDLSELRGLMRSPSAYLRKLSGSARTLIVHGNFLTADDQAFLADHRATMSLVHCPRTHEYFGHPPFPLGEWLERGARVALGTDSRASNPDLSMLRELRAAARLHPQVAPAAILRLATRSGAVALGDGRRGSLAPGNAAEWIAVQIPTPCADPEEAVARGEGALLGVFAGQRWVGGGDFGCDNGRRDVS